MRAGHRAALGLAAAAALCFSTAPVVLIWAEPLSAYEKAMWRMCIATLTVAVLAWLQGKPPRYARGDGRKFVLYGLVTALHFLTFVASLNFTSIAHAVTVTYTAPIFVTLFSTLILKERIPPRKWLGVLVVLLGIGVLVGFEPTLTPRMLIGDGLALLSAISFGVYSIMGRSQRETYPLLTYTFGIYGIATLWLIPAAAVSFTPGGYGLQQVLALLWVGVVPLGIGHTLYNAAIRRTHATYANLIATQEVTGSVILGALLLGQTPGANAVIGIVIALAGIALVVL